MENDARPIGIKARAAELANKLGQEDISHVFEALEDSGNKIKFLLHTRVAQMNELGLFPSEEVMIRAFGQRENTPLTAIIDGKTVYRLPDYENPRFGLSYSGDPFISSDGILYMCETVLLEFPAWTERMTNWSTRREAYPEEYVEYGPMTLTFLSIWLNKQSALIEGQELASQVSS